MVRVCLVDDHRMFREGLRAILTRDSEIEVVSEASNGQTALDLMAGEQLPEVVIIDVGMPKFGGVEVTRQILSWHPKIKVIALSAHSDPHLVRSMLEAGAMAYVLKVSAGEEIIQAIHAVHSGRKYLSPTIAHVVIEGYLDQRSTGHHARSGRLAAREREVVQLLAEGKKSKDIATTLSLSVKTVETHRRNIMRKLKLHNVVALTKFAIREGLTSIEE